MQNDEDIFDDLSLLQKVEPIEKVVFLLICLSLVAIPVSWFLPLLRNSLFIVFGQDISIYTGLYDLYSYDKFLWFVILMFATVVPFVKQILLVLIWVLLRYKNEALVTITELMAKFSMTDVFLIALVVVGIKGVGIGSIDLKFGFYFFTIVVIVNILLGYLTRCYVNREMKNLDT